MYDMWDTGPRKKGKAQPLFGDFGASAYDSEYVRPKTKVVYVERRTARRKSYRPKQPQYSVGDYAKATVKGAKSAYGGAKATYKGAKTTYRGAKKTYGTVSKFVSKIGKPKTMQDRTLREKLRGSIYKKE